MGVAEIETAQLAAVSRKWSDAPKTSESEEGAPGWITGNSEEAPPPESQSSNSAGRNSNWIRRGILIIMAAALVFQVVQTRLLADQLERQFAVPNLRAEAFQGFKEIRDLSEERAEIVEEFFQTVSRLSDENIGVSYVELLEVALPISRELSPAPIEVEVVIENIGIGTATNVSVSISWLGEITRIDAEALSGWTVIDGGEGEDQAVIQIERVTVDELVIVTVEYAAYSQAQDKLVLSIDPTGFPSSISSIFGPYFSPPPVDLSFPTFRIEVDPVAIDFEAITVRIGSDQTSMQIVEVASFFSGLPAAFEAGE